MKIVTYRFYEDGLSGGVPNAVDILQRELDALLVWDFDSAHTSSLNLKRDPPESSLHTGGSSRSFYGGTSPEAFIAADSLQGENILSAKAKLDMRFGTCPVARNI